jgi:hypothetical protein
VGAVRLLTTGEAAQRPGCREWAVVRVYRRSLLPPAPRLGRARAIFEADLPALAEALRRAGYLPAPAAGPAPAAC